MPAHADFTNTDDVSSHACTGHTLSATTDSLAPAQASESARRRLIRKAEEDRQDTGQI